MNYRPELEPQPSNHTPPPEKIEPDPRVITLQNPDASPDEANQAFSGIHTEFAGPIRGYILRMVGSPDLADDILQVTMVNAWRGITRGQFDPHDENSALSPWLYRVAYNATSNTLRSEKKRIGDMPYEEAIGGGPDVGRSRAEDDPQRRLEFMEEIGVLEGLSDIVRETLSWNLDEYTYEQIAAMNGITVGAVKSRLVRAREASQKARAELGLTEAEKAEIKERKKAGRKQAREARREEDTEQDEELVLAA